MIFVVIVTVAAGGLVAVVVSDPLGLVFAEDFGAGVPEAAPHLVVVEAVPGLVIDRGG
jgi:hypothetical protein